MIVHEVCRQFLADCGVNSDRLALEWASAAEAPRFVELITAYVKKAKELGPLGSYEGEVDPATMRRRLQAAVDAASARKPRTATGNLAKRLAASRDYSPETITEGVRDKILPALRAERIKNEILMVLADAPKDLDSLSAAVGAGTDEVEKALAPLLKKGSAREEDGKYVLGS